MKYTIKQTATHLGEVMMAAWSGEEVIIVRDGRPIAQLVHRGPQLRTRAARRMGAISYKRTPPIRSRELSDLGFE